MSLTVQETPSRLALSAPFRAPIGLRELLTITFCHRGKIVAAFVLPFLVAAALFFIAPKTYRAQTNILVKAGREYMSPPDGGSAAAPTSTMQEDINSEMTLLTSRAVTQSTIDSIGLKNLYPDLVANPPGGLSLMDAAVKRFDADRGVDAVKMSNIISVTFDAPSVEQAQMVLNRLIQVFIAKHTQVFAGKRTAGYEDSIKLALREIDRLEEQRTNIKVSAGIYDIAAQRAALITQRIEAEGHLQDVINNQSTLQHRLAYLVSVRSQIPTTMQSTSTDKNDEAVHGHEALMDLRQQEASMSARYGRNNPDLQRVQAQIAALEHTISGTANSRTSVAEAPSPLRQQVEQEIVMDNAQLAPLDAERARYEALVASLGAELSRLEQADLALRTTTTRLDALNDNLKSLQAAFEQARTEEQTELAKQVSVVQMAGAIAPDKPAAPKKIIFLGAALVGGIVIAGCIMVVSIVMNNTLASEEAAERLIGLRVLVSMPLGDRRSGPMRPELE
jgi:uncharacterized protein involved in exopolysaccharide biosynthesis